MVALFEVSFAFRLKSDMVFIANKHIMRHPCWSRVRLSERFYVPARRFNPSETMTYSFSLAAEQQFRVILDQARRNVPDQSFSRSLDAACAAEVIEAGA